MFDQMPHDVCSLGGGHFNKAYDARMRQATQEHKFPKILVLSNEHTTFLDGERQQCFVRRTGKKVKNGQDIASKICQGSKERL